MTKHHRRRTGFDRSANFAQASGEGESYQRGVTCWVSLAVAAVIAAPPAWAQAASDRSREFAIPAQALSSALLSLGDQCGLQFSLDSGLVEGKPSPGLKGIHSCSAGLQALLDGSGLAFRFTSANTVVIEKVAPKNTRVLGPVRVEGAEGRAAVNGINGSRDVTATEGTGSYTSNALTIGSKLPLSMKDTPQSVSVITAQRMEEQNITDFTKAMERATGVTLIQGQTSLENTFYSRGFAISSLQIDGGPPMTIGSATGLLNPQIDMAQYDHVELLRGAAGLFNGYGEPSGTVNLVRKKPLDHGRVSVGLSAGSWSDYRVVLDASGPLGFGGKLRGRSVVSYQDNEFFYDMASTNRTSIYGVLDYDLTPSTLVTLGASSAQQRALPWQAGLPRFQTGDDLNLPRSAALAFPWNRSNVDTLEIFALAEQRLGDNWRLKLNLTHNQQDTDSKTGSVFGTVNPLTHAGPTIGASATKRGSKQILGEVTLNGTFEVLGQRQVVSVGLNRADATGGSSRNYTSPISNSPANPYIPYPGAPAGIPRVDVFNFDPNDPLYSEPRNGLLSTITHESGTVRTVAYVNMILTAFDRWHVNTGLRYGKFESWSVVDSVCTNTTGTCAGKQIGDLMNAAPNVSNYGANDISWPPTYTLGYDLTENISLHGSYHDIYIDQSTTLDANLKQLEPTTGSNIEAGAKWQARDGRLNVNVAGYLTQKKNLNINDFNSMLPDGRFFDNFGNVYQSRILPDGVHSCCSILSPDRIHRSEGADLDVTGEVLPRWQVSAGYSYNKNKYVGSSYSNEGKPLVSQSPVHLFKVWSSYAFRGPGWINRLSIGGGVSGQTSAYQTGDACIELNAPNPATGISSCRTRVVYDYTQGGYAVWSARAGLQLNSDWTLAINVENLADKRYYRTMGSSDSGNWYGAPRSFMVEMRGRL